MPPSIAPGILPIPPKTAATKALIPGRAPRVGSKVSYWAMKRTPATAARAEPTAKVLNSDAEFE